MDYEVVIPAAEKDFNKLPYLYRSIQLLNPQPTKVTLVTPDFTFPTLYTSPAFNDLRAEVGIPIKNIYDSETLPGLDPTAAKGFNRPQWIFQQFIKLFQNFTSRYYLVLDSDIIINRPLDLFTDGKPTFFLGVDQNHTPYFNYSQETFGFGRVYPHSFISEIMLFDKEKCDELLDLIVAHAPALFRYLSRENLIRVLYNFTTAKANNDWIPADYEIYGNFVSKYYPSSYTTRHIKTSLRGQYSEWSNQQIESYIAEMAGTDYDTFTLHTWI